MSQYGYICYYYITKIFYISILLQLLQPFMGEESNEGNSKY